MNPIGVSGKHAVAALSILLAASSAFAEGSVRPSYLELAERLRSLGSYDACTVEALRHGYLWPAERPRAFERAALCLDLGKRFGEARKLMLDLAQAEPTALDARGRFRLCLSETFVNLAQVSPACAVPASTERLDGLAGHTLVMRAIHARQWEAARLLLARVPEPMEPTLAAWASEDRALVAKQATLPTKSPWIAGGLSTLVPGLGRVYLGRWQDGLMSLILVGMPAAFAANGFYTEGTRSVRGWLLGAFSSVLYVGNVYGSAVGARVYNREREEELQGEVERAYQQRLDP